MKIESIGVSLNCQIHTKLVDCFWLLKKLGNENWRKRVIDKQESHGPHRSPEKTTCMIISSCWLREEKTIINFMTFHWFFICTNLNSLYPRMLCAKFDWNWPSGSGDEDFLISSMYFRYFVIISPWKRAGSFIWINLNPLYPRMLWLKLAQWFWIRRCLKFINVFSLFPNYLPLERTGLFIWTNLNLLHPRMHCAKFDWNWPSDSGEEDFLIS